MEIHPALVHRGCGRLGCAGRQPQRRCSGSEKTEPYMSGTLHFVVFVKGGSGADDASSSGGSDDEYDPTKKGTASAADSDKKSQESLTSQQREQVSLVSSSLTAYRHLTMLP